MNKIVIIGMPQEDAPCEYCGKMDELRPYGKNGAKICYKCAMLPENKETTDAAYKAILSGESETNTDQQKN